MTKRFFDVLVSLVLLTVLTPVLLVICIAIPIADPGPILYRANRVGLNGRPFVMHKFRSMSVEADQGSAISSTDDPRIFRFGKRLRMLKLDELPQLWDVLRGEMSIVGPRPEDPDIVARHYTDDYLRTLCMRPGLTSPGSLYFYAHAEELLLHGSAEVDYAESILPKKMKLDLEYVEQNSVIMDIAIVIRTIAVIVGRIFRHRNNAVE